MAYCIDASTSTMSVILSSDNVLPFHGYRSPRVDGSGFDRGLPDLYSTIEHFFQSEKFRGVDEGFRRMLLDLPTAREVRKAATRRDVDIRQDWERIQNRVMETAIWLKCREHVEVKAALLALQDFGGLYRFKDHYWGSGRDGVSVEFYGRVLSSVQSRLKHGGMRVLITGSREFSNQFLFSSKLDAFFKKALPDEVLIGCAKGADAMAEAWALAKYIPVSHYPMKGRRSKTTRATRNSLMIDAATHLVAFAQGEGGDVSELIEMAKIKALPSRVVQLDAEGRLIKPTSQTVRNALTPGTPKK
jgi:predicted NAD-dependent protein-ADP-ribosyltransferase YbiA (DUF1768 family)